MPALYPKTGFPYLDHAHSQSIFTDGLRSTGATGQWRAGLQQITSEVWTVSPGWLQLIPLNISRSSEPESFMKNSVQSPASRVFNFLLVRCTKTRMGWGWAGLQSPKDWRHCLINSAAFHSLRPQNCLWLCPIGVSSWLCLGFAYLIPESQKAP